MRAPTSTASAPRSTSCARLRPIADKLRPIDPAAAATLDCQIAVGERRYADAVTGARTALGKVENIPELYICLAQAQALARDLAGGEQTAKKAFDLWPIDYREWGGFAQYAEFFLYRGKLDDYRDRGAPAGARGPPERGHADADRA
jgi:hypothetical protein